MERKFGKPRFDKNRRSGGFGDRGSGFRDRDGGFGDRSGGFRNERRDDFPKPVNEGEEYDVEINEVGTKGDGIARVKNFVIFVANTKEGEKCRVKITMVRPKFAVAEKVSEKSAELKEPKAELKKEKVKKVTDELELDEEGENFDED